MSGERPVPCLHLVRGACLIARELANECGLWCAGYAPGGLGITMAMDRLLWEEILERRRGHAPGALGIDHEAHRRREEEERRCAT